MVYLLSISIGIFLVEVIFIGREVIRITKLDHEHSQKKIASDLQAQLLNLSEELEIAVKEKTKAQNELSGIHYLWGKTIADNTKLRMDLAIAEKQLHYLAQKALAHQNKPTKDYWTPKDSKISVEASFI